MTAIAAVTANSFDCSAPAYSPQKPKVQESATSRSIILDQDYEQIRSLILRKAKDASRPDWDGEGASPIDYYALRFAMLLAKSLPSGLGIPDVYVEPEGEIGFEWARSPREILEIVVGARGRIHYASLIGTERHYGSVPIHHGIPEEVIRRIRRITR